ncbi:MAG TPA: pyridoxamine 5'-phosphate oxidase family protein [Acidimicrobiales bacterium]|nr:pyridoxamine 5'-phosphate oxidase family protein [Acidimicrobiales bacterium]
MIVDDVGLAVLDEAECLDLLGRASVGRVAVSIGAVPAVFPVNYGILDGMIVFRTGTGTKLDAATRNAVIAFEVDEVDLTYHEGWSVLAVGIAGVLHDPVQIERALALPLASWAPGHRDHVVCLAPEFVSGRRIVHEGPGPASA